MPLLSAADIDAAIVAAGGVDVTIAGVTVKGIRRAPDVSFFADDEHDLIGRSVTVLVRDGSLPGLATGVAIVVAGESMKVHRYQAEANGSALPAGVSLTRILCKKA